jgi:hypothetical protein
MLNSPEPISIQNRLLGDYVTEEQMADARQVTRRTLRAERHRGEGPPYVKTSNKVLYSADGFRQWLKSIERRPVRERRV